MVDYAYMAHSLANLSGIPVRLYLDGKFAGLYHTGKFKPDLAILREPEIFSNPASVSYYMTPEFLFYGLFRLKKQPVCMVLGPVAQLPVDKAAAVRILRSIGEPAGRAAELQNYFATIPGYPLRNFLQILCTVATFLNEEKISVSDILAGELPPTTSRQEQPLDAAADRAATAVTGHDTYALEQQMLSLIETGRPDELRQLFAQPAAGRAGTMAQDTLRQQKNLLIVTATLASRAAVRGGLDTGTAFGLSDLYIQKAELLTGYEAIARLQLQMVLDFAGQVQALLCGAGGHSVIRKARQYILAHVGEGLTTQQLAAALHCNRTYLCSLFRRELGQTVNEYITRTRLEEAKRLLRLTQKPLHAVAEQVGFSSQSYFQNVFKKHEGITPQQYRNG